MQAEVVGVCIPVSGHEEDYLQFIDGEQDYLGACSLLEQAGAEPTRWNIEVAYDGNPFFGNYVREFLEKSSRRFPPLYRVRISVECEELPADEIAAYWTAKLLVAKEHFEEHRDLYERAEPENTPWEILGITKETEPASPTTTPKVP